MTREEVLIELMHAHQRGIWRYLRFLGADVALADDLTQETFVGAFGEPFEERGYAATAAYLRLAAVPRSGTVAPIEHSCKVSRNCEAPQPKRG